MTTVGFIGAGHIGGTVARLALQGITGLLYGISIASLLMSIRRKARPGPA